MYYFVDQSNVQAVLNLVRVAGRDVRDRPANFFSNGLLRMVKQLCKGFKHTTVDSCLCILVSCRQDIAKCSQGWNCNNHLVMLEQLAKAWHHIALEEDYNSLVSAFICDV